MLVSSRAHLLASKSELLGDLRVRAPLKMQRLYLLKCGERHLAWASPLPRRHGSGELPEMILDRAGTALCLRMFDVQQDEEVHSGI